LKSIRLLLALGLTLALSSCSLTVTSESFAGKAKERLEKKIEAQGKTHIQNRYLLNPAVTVFFLGTAKGVPNESASKITSRFEKGLGELGLFETLTGPQYSSVKLIDNRALKIRSEIYFDSLGAVAVSDRDIANPLGRFLGVGNFLVGQVSLWPCAGCDNQSFIRVKLRLVDVESGDILWTASAERELFGFELAEVEPIALELADNLVEIFHDRFRTKWHRARYENLKG